MKRFKAGRAQNNKGFTLIEVLVTILVIAIASIPLIRSFVMTANVNHKARRLQNATDVAQNVSEYFAARPFSELLANHGKDGNGLSPDGDMYVFKNIKDGSKDYYEGAEGEKFYVTVVMDGKDYEEYTVPELKNLFGSGGVTCFKEIFMYDQAAVNYLVATNGYPEASTAASLGIKKTTDIYIDTYMDGSYGYYVNVTYTDSSGKTYETGRMKLEEVKAGSDDVATERFPNLYIMYQPYGVYGPIYTDYVDDVVNIHYVQKESKDGSYVPSTNTEALNTNVYFVQQNAQHTASGMSMKFNVDSNCHIDYNGVAYDEANPGHLNFYSQGADSITNGDGASVRLYTVDVYVTYDKPDETSYTDYYERKASKSDVYVSVSTIREE